MNRTLRRPMFRIGGSVAEGITSGLDQHQPTASRVGYKDGETIGQEYKRTRAALDEVRPQRRPYWPQFATSFGLDLLTRPKSGNIFQQLAASAKGPYDKWMEHRASRYDTDDKLSAALFGDIMDIRSQRELKEKELASEERIAKIDAEADIKSGAKTYKDQVMLDRYAELIDEGHGLTNQLKELEEMPVEHDEAQADKDRRIRNLKDKLDKNAKLQAQFADAEEDPIRKAILDGISTMVTTFADLVYYDQTKEKTGKGEIPPNLLEEKAEGGRVGYQMGGTSLPSAAPAAMQAAVPAAGTMDQGAEQDSPVQDLSFEELRARLPQEITDDIIQLIANSKQALVDFANIRTQQDVNAFNQKYDVNLVVPQEA